MDYSYSTSTTTSSGGLGIAIILIILTVSLIAYLFYGFVYGRIFKKFNKPSWAGFVPVYNNWIFFELAGLPGWLALLSVISIVPLLGFLTGIALLVVACIANYRVSKLFGKSDGFAVCSIFFPYVTLPILAFGGSTPVDGAGVAPGAPMATPAYPPVNFTPAVPVAAVPPVQPVVPQVPVAPAPQQPVQPQVVIQPTPAPLTNEFPPQPPQGGAAQG